MGLISNILNMEFRDFVRNSIYPFTDTSTLTTASGVMLPVDLFLDAALYPLPSYVLPYYLSSIKTVAGVLTFEIKDTYNLVIGTGVYKAGEEVIYFKNEYQAVVGSLLINLDLMEYVKQLAKNPQTLTPASSSFIPSVCFPIVDKRCTGLRVSGQPVPAYSNINIIAGDHVTIATHKVSITVNAPVAGAAGATPIKFINGYVFKNGQAWIMADEDSALRVATTTDGLMFGLNKDF